MALKIININTLINGTESTCSMAVDIILSIFVALPSWSALCTDSGITSELRSLFDLKH